jgi:uncharacterized protein YlxP (DUF503 family)
MILDSNIVFIDVENLYEKRLIHKKMLQKFIKTFFNLNLGGAHDSSQIRFSVNLFHSGGEHSHPLPIIGLD